MGRAREEKRREEKRGEERRGDETRRGEKIRRRSEEDQKKIRRRSKEDAGVRKGRKVAKHCVFFNVLWLWEGRKVGSLKRAGAEPCAQMRDEKLHCCGAKHMSKSKCTKQHLSFGALLEVEMSKKCTPRWREPHFQVKSVKN